jgi:geranylgeranyl transferase type-2 subunit alpha
MHGRPRNYQDKLKDPKVAEAYRKKVDAIKAGTTLVLRCRAAHRHDAAALTAADRLLRVVPELYTVWNFRREAAQPVLDAAVEAAQRLREKNKNKGGEDDQDDRAPTATAAAAAVAKGEAALAAELELSQACLRENPKSYCTWHHRRWALDQGVALRGGIRSEEEEEEEEGGQGERAAAASAAATSATTVPSTGRALLERELALVARALEADARNFHAWAHRRWVARRLGVSAARELAFAGAKVAADFSNYSAWHQRSLLLAEAAAEQQQGGQGRGEGQGEPGVATLDEVLGGGGEGVVGESAAGHGQLPSSSSSSLLPPDVLDAEFDVVHSAFATDSRDQSPWVYYAWLVGQALARLRAARAALRRAEQQQEQRGEGDGLSGLALALARAREADARAEAADRLARERARLEEEHLADDPDARWPLLTVARLKEAQARLGLFLEEGEEEEEQGGGEGGGEGGGPAAQRLLREAREAYERLAAIDPMRAGYYRDAAAGRASVAIGGEW